MNLEKLYRTDETIIFEILDLQLIKRPVTEFSVVFFSQSTKCQPVLARTMSLDYA